MVVVVLPRLELLGMLAAMLGRRAIISAWQGVALLALTVLGCERNGMPPSEAPRPVSEPTSEVVDRERESEVPSDRPRSVDTLALGRDGACWLRDDGRLVCFGIDHDGSLGGAASVPYGDPRVVAGLPEFVSISGYGERRCAIDVEGKVWCFGPMQVGGSVFWSWSPPRHVRLLELAWPLSHAVDGRGRVWRRDPDHEASEWTILDGIEGVEGVELSWNLGCGWTASRELQCFYDPSGTDSPIAVAHVTGLDPIDLSNPGGVAFVLDRSGRVVRVDPPEKGSPWAVSQTGMQDVVELDHRCGLHEDGSVSCLVNGKPTPVEKVPSARAIVANEHGVCLVAASDGDVYCQPYGRAARRFEHLSPATDLAAHGERWCALVGDQLRCTDQRGWNQRVPDLRGEELLGTNSELCVRAGTSVQCWDGDDVYRPPLDDVVGLTLVDRKVCARRADDSLLCLASFGYGEINTGPVAGLEPAVEVALGWGFACAREQTGKVRCWGVHGDAGQLGDGAARATLTPTPVAGLDDAIDIDASAAMACAVRASGTLVCWGRMQHLDAAAATPQSTPLQVPGIDDAVRVAIDVGRHANPDVCVLHRDGRVSCTSDFSPCAGAPTSTFTFVPDITDAVDVSVGLGDHCAVRSGDVVSCWGATRSCSDSFWLEDVAGRGVEVQWNWRCVDRVEGPTCWGLSRHEKRPDLSFPFADPLDPDSQPRWPTTVSTIAFTP